MGSPATAVAIEATILSKRRANTGPPGRVRPSMAGDRVQDPATGGDGDFVGLGADHSRGERSAFDVEYPPLGRIRWRGPAWFQAGIPRKAPARGVMMRAVRCRPARLNCEPSEITPSRCRMASVDPASAAIAAGHHVRKQADRLQITPVPPIVRAKNRRGGGRFIEFRAVVGSGAHTRRRWGRARDVGTCRRGISHPRVICR